MIKCSASFYQKVQIAYSVLKQANLGMLHGEVGCRITVWSLSRDLFGDLQQLEVSFLLHHEVVFTQIINQTVSIRVKTVFNANLIMPKHLFECKSLTFGVYPLIKKGHCLSHYY